MNAVTAESPWILNISKTYKAPVQAVFDAWTHAGSVAGWFAPSDDFTTVVHELDLRVGGRYRFEMQDPEGGVFIVFGEYVDISSPHRLVFTWSWEHEPENEVMLVTVELNEQGDETKLSLLHETLPSAGSRDHHEQGWMGCLMRLGSLTT